MTTLLTDAQFAVLDAAAENTRCLVSEYQDRRTVQALLRLGYVGLVEQPAQGFAYAITIQGYRAMLRTAMSHDKEFEAGVEAIVRNCATIPRPY